jgi:hypothetical protein
MIDDVSIRRSGQPSNANDILEELLDYFRLYFPRYVG